ncbi:hypothetical protein Q7P36_010248 [Cladosporium allicinum]
MSLLHVPSTARSAYTEQVHEMSILQESKTTHQGFAEATAPVSPGKRRHGRRDDWWYHSLRLTHRGGRRPRKQRPGFWHSSKPKVPIPFALMNSFNTDKDTANIIKKYEGHNIDILTCAKTKADVKGGTIIDYEGRVGCQTVNAWIQRGVEIVTERKIAERSMLIKNMIEDFGSPGEEPIPIMNVFEKSP